MKLSGLHLLLTYQCTFECDHCFVWGSPRQSGVMTLGNIRHILSEAHDLGTSGPNGLLKRYIDLLCRM